MIHFTCPNCQKHYEVKDDLAGKKTKCLRCQQLIAVPAAASVTPALDKAGPAISASVPVPSTAAAPPTPPTPTPSTPSPPPSAAAPAPPPDQVPVDVESLAAAALADEPAPAAAPEPTDIEFPCPFCDAKVSLPSSLAGKRAPCPECRRIIKVPELVKQEPIDWRKRESRLPSGARQAQEVAPEGAWGTATSAARVSQQALVEAEALPIVKERVTPKQWAQRIGMSLAALALAAGAIVFIVQKRSEGRQQKALDLASEYLPPEKGEKKDEAKTKLLSSIAVANLWRAIAEYEFAANKPDDAVKHLQRSRALAMGDKTAERDALLLEIAELQFQLDPNKEDTDQKKKQKWEQFVKDLQPTIREIQLPEIRMEAFRSVARRLVQKSQWPRAVGLASALASSPGQLPEFMAIVGLEMLSENDANLPPKLVAGALSPYSQKSQPAVSPSLIALLLARPDLGNPQEVAAEPGGEGEMDPLVRLGYAEGYARKGELRRARELALTRGPAEDRLKALAAVAALTLEKDRNDTTDLQTALELVKEAQGRSATSGPLWRLARAAARAGQVKLAHDLAAAIPDPVLRGRAQLEIFRARLKNSNDRIDFATVEEIVDKQTPAYFVALLEWARHNTRHGGSSDVLKAIAGWEPEALRPFGYIGVALGEQK